MEKFPKSKFPQIPFENRGSPGLPFLRTHMQNNRHFWPFHFFLTLVPERMIFLEGSSSEKLLGFHASIMECASNFELLTCAKIIKKNSPGKRSANKILFVCLFFLFPDEERSFHNGFLSDSNLTSPTDSAILSTFTRNLQS